MFDWLEDFSSMEPLFKDLITHKSKILMVGCGNSLLSEDLYNHGYKNIYNMDISSVVIEQMKFRNKDRPEMMHHTMDCTKMDYPDAEFDIAIDKSTIDALLCGDSAFVNVAKMTKEISRVLKPGGKYLCITYGNFKNRDEHFRRPFHSWHIK